MYYICNDCGYECQCNYANRTCPKCGSTDLIPESPDAPTACDNIYWDFTEEENYDEV